MKEENKLNYLFKMFWKYSEEDKWKVVSLYILHCISLGGELLKPYAFGNAINALQINGVDNLKPTVIWLIVYVGGFFQFEIFHRIGQYFVTTTALGNEKRFISDMYNRVYNLPIEWHVNNHSGSVVSRINIAGEALRDFGYSQQIFLQHLFLSIGPIIILISTSWQIGVISLVLTIINLSIIKKMNRLIQSILNKKTEYRHSYTTKLIDFVSNIRTIISLKLGNQTKNELEDKFNKYYVESMNEFKVNQFRCFMIGFGLILTELVVISYYLWNHKAAHIPIMVGNLVMIVNYFRQMSESFFQITSNFYETLHWESALKSVNPIFQETEKSLTTFWKSSSFSTSANWRCSYLKIPLLGVKSCSKVVKHSIEDDALICDCEEKITNWDKFFVENLSFAYSKEKLALSNININITKGSKIAIVGLSGSGKSTLLSLLAGFYEPLKVKLTVGNKEYQNLQLISNTAILASQDVEIFESTVLANITFGLECNYSDLEKVIHMASLNEVINKLPRGLDTDIREKGVNLSGGEKQRIALARALFFSKSKKILLLDEITSSVDAFNERLIFQRIFENNGERSTICTVHRLHLLDMFDTVLVMDKGEIVQKGCFSELINAEGHFKILWEKYLTTSKMIP